VTPQTRKTIVRIALTVLILAGGVGAVASLRDMGWGAVGRALAGVSLLLLGAAFLVSTLQVFAQLARFVVLVPQEVRPPMLELLDATAIGQLLNYATPLRSGDAYKLLRLAPVGEHKMRRFAPLLAALLVERVADIAALVVMATWASASDLARWARSAVPARWVGAEVAALVAIAVVAAICLIASLRRIVRRFLRDVWGSMASLRFARSFGISLLTWTLDAGTLWWTSRSGGYAISFRDAMQSVFVLNVGIAVPVTVGNLGVFEASLAFGLSHHGIPAQNALAIATLEHCAKFAGLGLCVGALRLARVFGVGKPKSVEEPA
jgi:uncharacterized membrane protein YbhN (UPF0104 family)